MPVLSGRIITPSSSDPVALVAVYNGEIVSWLWQYTFFLFCFEFVTWFCHNLNRHASLLRNILTGNQTASFYFQVGMSLQPFLATILPEICIYLEWYPQKKNSLLVKTLYLYILTKYCRGQLKMKKKRCPA